MRRVWPQVDAAEARGKQTVLINPQLSDIPSHSGVMGVRGREGRIGFAQSFVIAYHCRLLYYSGAPSMLPVARPGVCTSM